jgi:cell division protein FtsI/penicillin-binding protein 2
VLGRVGESGGSSGLQRALEDQLAGASGLAVAVVQATGGSPVRVVAFFPGKAADDQRTTLDLGVQRAAEKAIGGFRGKAALVAVDAPTGEIRAIANTPVEGLPPALATRYAPGSTFKVITATAALLHGRSTSSAVSCPGTISAGGVTFHNHERSPSTRLTLTEAFARSCNTAFIGLARDLPDGALAEAAALYGFGLDPLLPIAAVSGEVPTPESPQEAAADAIGQGRVGASPLVMATVAAAVADGTWRQPHLIRCPDCTSHRIPVAGSLRTMMRAVVTSGTGTAAAGVAGGPVYGKTGTAEYGSGDPPPTHAWFIGWQGRTAFAVFVEDGSSGGAVAAPVAARFLRLIGGG